MEISDSNGRTRLPKWAREKLGSFVEKDGRIFIEKNPQEKIDLEKLNEILRPLREEIRKEGYTEEQMMKDLEEARKELWNEWKPKNKNK